MRIFRLPTVLSLSLAAALVIFRPHAYAQTDSDSASKAANSAAGTNAPSAETDLRSEVEQLQQLVHEQQKRIAALEAERTTTPPQEIASAPLTPSAGGSENAVPLAAASQSQNPPQIQNVQAGSTDERIRNLERQIKGIGPISFSGDVRLRGEPFFGGPTDQSLDRVRGRFRARFNAVADLGSQFRAGVTLASGDINDPISANQTLTGFYARKAVALDQAFAQFTPKKFQHLTLIGGKFQYPWYNTFGAREEQPSSARQE